MKYIYGPVKSRRLGLSLGISLTPYKICDFDCIYCQLGKTEEPVVTRKEYARTEDILNELKSWWENNTEVKKILNYITISGSGEPTLNTKIGEVITEIKKITATPIAVITNASLLNDIGVRQALLTADLIVPSLDTVSPEIFRQIDRPHPDIKIEEIICGLVSLRKEFSGKIWLEVMIVKGVNDDLAQIRKLKDVIDKINPDKVQLNSPVRTTTEKNIFPTDKRKLNKIKEILGDKCEII
jgi:wyosine [tRNA(Phe)-imidazoG37] synthetase (radical SAM superfamily)